MAVKIRLKRLGGKKDPFFRIVVADSRSPRDGRFIDELGYYDPVADPEVIEIMEDKALDWLRRGAQPSSTVKALFSKVGLLKKLEESRGN